jgi:hypothetical protein
MVYAWRGPPSDKFAGAQCGVQETFALAGIKDHPANPTSFDQRHEAFVVTSSADDAGP